MSVNKRLRFTTEEDILLLREIVSNNPFENFEKWKVIQETINKITGKNFTVRALKDHFQRLLSLWKKKDESDKIRSGVEEVYTEKDHLLQEISDFVKNINPAAAKKKRKISKEEVSNQIGKEIRDDLAIEFSNATSEANTMTYYVVENFADGSCSEIQHCQIESGSPATHDTPQEHTNNEIISDLGNNLNTDVETTNTQVPKKFSRVQVPIRKRNNKNNHLKKTALIYLNDKGEREHMLRVKELELKERELNIAERKLNLEERRLEAEIEGKRENRGIIDMMFKQQLRLIEVLTKKLDQ